MEKCWICNRKTFLNSCKICGSLFCDQCGDMKTRTCTNCEGYEHDLPEIEIEI